MELASVVAFTGAGEELFAEAVASIEEDISHSRRTSLCEIMTRHGSDKGQGRHNYTLVYDRIFRDVRETTCSVFEVGIGTNYTDIPSSMGEGGSPGASLRGWREYFSKANIYSADIDTRILFDEDRIRTFYVDQCDSVAIRALWSVIPHIMFDIIVDDGLHIFEANKCFILNSMDRLREDGYFIIEDIKKDISVVKDYLELFEAENLDAFVMSLDLKANREDNVIAVIKKRSIEKA